MHTINSPFQLGRLTLPHRLIQGPLAGYSCAPFRSLFYQYTAPAYAVSEMISATDVLHKHAPDSRYLHRAAVEQRLAYQLSGTEPQIMADAALRLQQLGADLIDVNCGCPKLKIRKKGAGSALLAQPELLVRIISTMRTVLTIPLTVKIRLQEPGIDRELACAIAEAGADGLIVHGRRWQDDYDVACDLARIGLIKQQLSIPVIANGDIADSLSLARARELSGCDAFMIGRAGSGKPWLFQELLQGEHTPRQFDEKKTVFMQHLHGLACLEHEFKAVLQSKSLIRYYFRAFFSEQQLATFYQLNTLTAIEDFLDTNRATVRA